LFDITLRVDISTLKPDEIGKVFNEFPKYLYQPEIAAWLYM